MNFRAVRPAFALLLFAGLLPAADQQLMSLLMPDAKVVAGINVEQAKNSPFGQFLLTQMQNGSGGFGKLAAVIGFDPTKDLGEVLMGTLGQPARQGLVLAKGTFNPELVFAAAQAGGHTVETYHGVQILTGKDDSITHAVAFLGGAIAVAGDLDSVHGAIDRRAAGSGISIDPALAAMVNQLSNSLDAWSVSTAPLAALAGQKFPDATLNGLLNSDVLKSIQQTSAGVKLGAIVQLSAQLVASSSQSAASLADVLRFLESMVQANAPASSAAAITSLVQSLNVQADGNNVNLALSIPEEQLEGFVRTAEQGNAKHAAHDRL
jgi:hypothetical protein